MSEQMMFPVRCTHCRNGVYDLGKVEVTARYADCSMWKSPCCNRLVDDRGDTGWKSRKDYVKLSQAELEAHQRGGVDVCGMPYGPWGVR